MKFKKAMNVMRMLFSGWVCRKYIYDIVQKRNSTGLFPINEVLILHFPTLKNYITMQELLQVFCGFIELDRKTAGFQRSDLIYRSTTCYERRICIEHCSPCSHLSASPSCYFQS